MPTIRIQVKREDIKHGVHQSKNSCPVARAIKRCLATTNVFVNNSTALIDGKRFFLPKNAQKFIWQFDMDQSVLPLDFQLGENQ